MITIVTLNINYYVEKHGKWTDRRENILTALRQAQPEIVALQAVRQDPAVEAGVDQATQLAEQLGFGHVFFQPAVTYPDGSAEGSAIIARLPIEDWEALELSRIEGGEDPTFRVLLHARFDLPGAALHLFNGHFSWVSEQATKNLEEAIPFITKYSDPGLLVGDFNMPAGTPLLERIEQAGWADAWQQKHAGEDGFTFESNEPKIRIDYAWLNPALQDCLEDIQVLQTGEEGQGKRFSDHLGLQIRLDLPE